MTENIDQRQPQPASIKERDTHTLLTTTTYYYIISSPPPLELDQIGPFVPPKPLLKMLLNL